MKAIILARVSTEEQKETGNSLPAQQARLVSYIEKNENLTLIKEFVFDESAYKEHRKEFQKIINFIEQQKETVALCCDKVDRLSRDFLVGLPLLEKLRRNGNIELHLPSDNLVLHKDSPATDLFHYNIAVSLAQYYSNAISDNIKRAWEQKIRNGEIMTKAPIGYFNRRIDEKQDVYIDEVRAPHIVEIFELYATGLYSMQKIATEMEKEGLRSRHYNKVLKVRQIETILKNHFYCGFNTYKKKNITYAHKYESLISKELFDKCTAIREAKTKNKTKATKHEFIFSGLIPCGDCGCRITPELKKGKYKYYHCTNHKKICKKVFVREERLLEPIHEVMNRLSLNDAEIDQILNAYEEHSLDYNKHTDGQLKAHKAEYSQINGKIETMYDDKLDGRITTDMYDKKVKELNARKSELEQKIKKLQSGNTYCRITAKHLLSITQRLKNIFESSEVDEKKQILNLLFQNFSLQGKNFLFNTKTPFREVLECGISVNNVSWSG
jgi:site-specific DNA recombinase